MQHQKLFLISIFFDKINYQRPYCGSEVDVWSLGVILYAMLTGSLPFDDNNLPVLFRKIREAKFFLPLYLSPGSRDLLIRIMQPNPLNRITISEIKNHPWFTNNLPFYIQMMDNSKPEIPPDVNRTVFSQVCAVFFKKSNCNI